MVDPGIDRGHLQLVGPLLPAVVQTVETGDATEGLGRLPRMNLRIVPDNANFVRVPAVRAVVMVVVPPEVAIPEKQPLHLAIIQQFGAAAADFGKVLLVQHFIRLQIQEPIAGTGILGDIGLMGVLRPVRITFQIPPGIDDADFIRSDALDLLPRGVVRIAIPQRHHELVHKRERGKDRLADRIVEPGGIPRHCKAADFQLKIQNSRFKKRNERRRALRPSPLCSWCARNPDSQ